MPLVSWLYCNRIPLNLIKLSRKEKKNNIIVICCIDIFNACMSNPLTFFRSHFYNMPEYFVLIIPRLSLCQMFYREYLSVAIIAEWVWSLDSRGRVHALTTTIDWVFRFSPTRKSPCTSSDCRTR